VTALVRLFVAGRVAITSNRPLLVQEAKLRLTVERDIAAGSVHEVALLVQGADANKRGKTKLMLRISSKNEIKGTARRHFCIFDEFYLVMLLQITLSWLLLIRRRFAQLSRGFNGCTMTSVCALMDYLRRIPAKCV
jgi:hypothetical protein